MTPELSSWPSQDRRKKLTRSQVRLAKALVDSGATRKWVADQFGVSAEHISLIVAGLRRVKAVTHG